MLDAGRVDLRLGRIEDPLPAGTFDLVVSALAVHHLQGEAKAELFRRIHVSLRPGGRLVLADVVLPERSEDAVTLPTPDFRARWPTSFAGSRQRASPPP